MAIKVNNFALLNSVPVINELLATPGLPIPTLFELNVAVAKVVAAHQPVAKIRDEIIAEHRVPPAADAKPDAPPEITPEGMTKLQELFTLESEVDATPLSVSKLFAGMTKIGKDGREVDALTLQPLMWLLTA